MGYEAYLAGRNDEARSAYDNALQIYKTEDDRSGEANTLRALGDLEQKLDRNDEARAYYDKSLPLCKVVGDRLGEADTLRALGDLEQKLDRIDEARADYVKALPLYKAAGNRWGEGNTLRGLGYLELKAGRKSEARVHFRDAAIAYGLAGMKKEQTTMKKMASDLPSDEVKQLDAAWNRGEILGALAIIVTIIVAIIGSVATVFSSEIKQKTQQFWNRFRANN